MDWFIWLRDFAEHNQFFSGVAGASVIGGVLYWLRSLPYRMWEWAVWVGSIKVEIGNDSILFGPIEHWLADRGVSWHTRVLKVTTISGPRQPGGPPRPARYEDDDDDDVGFDYRLTPGRGSHWIRHSGWFYRVYREVPNEAHTNSQRVREVIYITTPGWSRTRIIKLLDEAKATLAKRESFTVMVRRLTYWDVLDRRRPRPLSSLVLPPGLVESVVDDIQAFRASEDWYTDNGVPYRRGYFFIGPPGGGKTSTALAIAGHFGMSVYVLNLGSMGGDDALIDACAEVPANAMLLIEDVDAASAAVKREPVKKGEKDTRISLSALLNCIDGAVAREGRVLVMTSNHPERLDPALTRAGRVDMTVEFPFAGFDEASRLFARFFPDAPHALLALQRRYLPRAAADVQGVCLAHRNDPAAALTALIGPPTNGAAGPVDHHRDL